MTVLDTAVALRYFYFAMSWKADSVVLPDQSVDPKLLQYQWSTVSFVSKELRCKTTYRPAFTLWVRYVGSWSGTSGLPSPSPAWYICIDCKLDVFPHKAGAHDMKCSCMVPYTLHRASSINQSDLSNRCRSNRPKQQTSQDWFGKFVCSFVNWIASWWSN